MIRVLDASALLVVLHGEPGADEVEPVLEESLMSAVNWSEVIQKAAARGVDVTNLRDEVAALGVSVIDFDASSAELTAALWPTTKAAGLSLGDRACLALSIALDATAVTADKTWDNVDVGARVQVIR